MRYNFQQMTITVKPLFERHLYLSVTSNRTPLSKKGWKIERHLLIDRHFDIHYAN